MNPETQECLSFYGYGTGYFIKETDLARRRTGKETPVFCDTCPKRNDCWQAHKARVEKESPIETAAFIAAMDQAKASGDSQAGGRLAARLIEAGTSDPWMKSVFENMNRGAERK